MSSAVFNSRFQEAVHKPNISATKKLSVKAFFIDHFHRIKMEQSAQTHQADDQLALSYRHFYYTQEVRNRLSRIRTPSSVDEEKLRLHTKATFHFERDEAEYFECVERGEYEGDTIMDEIVAWEKLENLDVNWGTIESSLERNKAEREVEVGDLNGEGTADDPIVID